MLTVLTVAQMGNGRPVGRHREGVGMPQAGQCREKPTRGPACLREASPSWFFEEQKTDGKL